MVLSFEIARVIDENAVGYNKALKKRGKPLKFLGSDLSLGAAGYRNIPMATIKRLTKDFLEISKEVLEILKYLIIDLRKGWIT